MSLNDAINGVFSKKAAGTLLTLVACGALIWAILRGERAANAYVDARVEQKAGPIRRRTLKQDYYIKHLVDDLETERCKSGKVCHTAAQIDDEAQRAADAEEARYQREQQN